MQRIGIGLTVLLAALVAGAAGAETPDDGLSGAAWSESHMLTRYQGAFDAEFPAPDRLGSGDLRVTRGEVGPPHLEVPETIENATPRAWQPGRQPVRFGRKGSTFDGTPSSARSQAVPRRMTTTGSSLRGFIRTRSSR